MANSRYNWEAEMERVVACHHAGDDNGYEGLGVDNAGPLPRTLGNYYGSEIALPAAANTNISGWQASCHVAQESWVDTLPPEFLLIDPMASVGPGARLASGASLANDSAPAGRSSTNVAALGQAVMKDVFAETGSQITEPNQCEPASVDDIMVSPMFMPSAPSHLNLRLPKDGWSQELETMLIDLRRAGYKFTEISNEMRARHGVEISPNALVKRFQRIQELFLEPLPEAVKNCMPELMASIRAHIDFSTLSETEKRELEGVLQELPQGIPKYVQNRVFRKRKTAQPPT